MLALPVLVLTAPFLAFTGYGTWLALSARGRRVLSHEHAALRARTPHLRAWSKPGEAFAVVGILVLNAWAVISAINYWG